VTTGALIVVAVLAGLIPAYVATRKGQTPFIGWWLFGTLLWIVALPVALLAKDIRPRCPFCAEDVRWEAVVCPHCQRDLPEGPVSVAPGRFGGMSNRAFWSWVFGVSVVFLSTVAIVGFLTRN
jgi:hypothetical protein